MSLKKLAVFGFSVCMGLSLLADEMSDPMKKIGGAFGGTRKASEAKDYQAIADHAAVIEKEFSATLGGWKKRNYADAVQWTEDGIAGAKALKAAADAKDEAGIRTASSKIGATCKSCHTTHREKLDDGTYKIK